MRRDAIPAEYVRQHLIDYIKDHDRDLELPGYKVLGPLATRLGMDVSYLAMVVMGKRKVISFDFVDRIFCGLGDPVRFWNSTPELTEAYEKLASVADEIATKHAKRTDAMRAYDREKSRARRARKRQERELALAA